MQFKPTDFKGGFCDTNDSRDMPFCNLINMLLPWEVVTVDHKQKWHQTMSNGKSNPQINKVLSSAVVWYVITLNCFKVKQIL